MAMGARERKPIARGLGMCRQRDSGTEPLPRGTQGRHPVSRYYVFNARQHIAYSICALKVLFKDVHCIDYVLLGDRKWWPT